MTNDEPPPFAQTSHQDRGARPLMVRLGLFLLIVGGVILVAAAILYTRVRQELGDYRDGIREAGYPLNLAELEEFHASRPGSEEGAARYQDAFDALETLAAESKVQEELSTARSDFDWIRDYPGELRRGLQDFVANHPDIIEAVHTATDGPPVRFPLDLEQGASVPLNHLSRVRNLGRVLVIESEGALLSGEVDRAVEAHRRILAVADTLRHEPILISQLVRVAVMGIGVDALEKLLATGALTSAHLKTLASIYDRDEPPEYLKMALAGELSMGAGPADFSGTGAGPSGPLAPIQRVWWEYEAMLLMRAMAPVVLSETQAWPEMLDTAERHGDIGMPSLMANMLLPALSRSSEAFARNAANLRNAQAAIAVERFRIEHGRLPYELAEVSERLPDGVPADPFSGGALKYLPKGEGYIVYSVYADRDDDSGAPYNRGNGAEGDWTFTVERTTNDGGEDSTGE